MRKRNIRRDNRRSQLFPLSNLFETHQPTSFPSFILHAFSKPGPRGLETIILQQGLLKQSFVFQLRKKSPQSKHWTGKTPHGFVQCACAHSLRWNNMFRQRKYVQMTIEMLLVRRGYRKLNTDSMYALTAAVMCGWNVLYMNIRPQFLRCVCIVLVCWISQYF